MVVVTCVLVDILPANASPLLWTKFCKGDQIKFIMYKQTCSFCVRDMATLIVSLTYTHEVVHDTQNETLKISGFRGGVVESFALLGC